MKNYEHYAINLHIKLLKSCWCVTGQIMLPLNTGFLFWSYKSKQM